MSGNIKGITIEIDGNTSKLGKALEGVNKKSRDIQGELKQVEKLLKFDPKNTELLAQKQKLLSDAVSKVKEKLDTLRAAQEKVSAQFKKGEIGESQYRAFQRELVKTEQELKGLDERLKISTSRFEQFGESARKSSETLKNTGDKIKGTGEKMSLAITVPILGAAAASAKLAMDYEAQMSRVQAISGATADELEKLNKQALDLGASTSFSAKEVAGGMEGLASAGFTVEETMAAMPGLLNLAASAGEELGTSADIAASTLRGFGLAADQAGHVADVLAKNAANTNAAVADTGEAMKYVAPVASAMGLSIEEVTASIGLMANAGIKGSQAGTTLRGSLSRLADPSKEAKEAMQDIGFAAFDSKGKLLPLKDLIDKLQKSTKGLTDQQKEQAISQIFGQEAMSGILSLIKAGPEELGKLTEGYKKADGAAKEMADTMLNNTKGSMEEAMGSLETAGIKIGTILAPAIIALSKIIGGLADTFANLPAPVQKMILVIAGLLAVIGPVLIVVGMMITAFGVVVPAVAGAAAAIAGLALPIGIAVAAIAGIIVLGTALVKNWDTIKAGAKAFGDALVNNFNWVVNTIGNAVGSIIGFFANIKLPEIKIPHIKLPHFNIKGEFSLSPPSIPSIGVDWYDKGGIFSSPSIIGVAEKRPEFVGALEDLRYLIRDELKTKPTEVNYNVEVHNPIPEKASESVRKQLMRVAYLGGV